jgi:tRNA-modifying protein YgfZ
MPGHSTVIPESYTAARASAALIHRTGRGFIVVSGKDRASYLHGLLTNDVASLKAGEGCYAAYLTAQGRMIADLWVYELGDVILLAVARESVDAVMSKLDQFIFSEDVQLGDVSLTFGAVAVVGPRAAAIVSEVVALPDGSALPASLPEHGNLRGEFEGETVVVIQVTDAGVAGYELLVAAARLPRLAAALSTKGAVELDDATADVIRIEAGVPKFHRDMDEETIPLEAGIESRAISLTKGCYVGQEVIIRVLHRGHGRVAEKLVGLKFSGNAVPEAGTVVTSSEGREIGRVTSSAFSPALGAAIGLAYLKRDFIEAGTHVTIGGSDALVSPLPFI